MQRTIILIVLAQFCNPFCVFVYVFVTVFLLPIILYRRAASPSSFETDGCHIYMMYIIITQNSTIFNDFWETVIFFNIFRVEFRFLFNASSISSSVKSTEFSEFEVNSAFLVSTPKDSVWAPLLLPNRCHLCVAVVGHLVNQCSRSWGSSLHCGQIGLVTRSTRFL